MQVDDLAAAVRRFLLEHASDFGLTAETLTVEYILNPGGFVNASFVIDDGTRRYHLKLADSAERRGALARWYRLRAQLERYHAPPIEAWVDIGDAAGILTPFLHGGRPTLTRAVLATVLPVLRGLHADREVYAALDAGAAPTAVTCYLTGYHDRFTEDLAHISIHRPPFIDDALLEWLHAEVARVAELVQSAASFEVAVEHAVHGDPWLDNVLWRDRSAWFLLDWDEMHVGDPACDIAMLTGPGADDLTPLKMFDDVVHDLTACERDRLRLLGRASLLDWTIDPVADWIEADAVAAHRDTVRLEKERVHRQALTLYRSLY